MNFQLQNLSIGYDHHMVKRNINISAESGQLICLIGKNGCGKSTLIRTLSGYLPMLSGNILINGKNMKSMSSRQKATQISIVLTESSHSDWLTVDDVVSMGRIPYSNWTGNLQNNDKIIIENAIKDANIEDLRYRHIDSLSDGEKERVFIAKAIAQDTPIILLDEPISHLDIPNRIETLHLLQKLSHQSNKIIIVSIHEIKLALRYADEIWMIKNDDLINGIPEDLVINGTMENFFEPLSFDTLNGDYILVNKNNIGFVNVKGEESINLHWTKLALNRIGFIINKDADCEIDVNLDNWILKRFGKEKTITSIGDLIKELRQHR